MQPKSPDFPDTLSQGEAAMKSPRLEEVGKSLFVRRKVQLAWQILQTFSVSRNAIFHQIQKVGQKDFSDRFQMM